MSGRMLAERWLASQLAALDCEVHRHPAPQEATHPVITIGLRAGVDIRSMGDPTRVERLTYDISAWDTGLSSLRVNTLYAEAHALLDGVPPVTVEGGVINACRRIGVIPIDSVIEEGTRYQRDGGLYVIEVIVHP